MAAPVTTGKLCTDVSQMIIGDMIKCVYEAPTANKAGYFSQFGALNPSIKVTTIRKNGENDPAPEITETFEEYPELPTDPQGTSSGYFYLIKASDGMLIADRIVQCDISWSNLNIKNYIYGQIADASKAASEKIVTITTTERSTQDGDVAGTTTSVVDDKFDLTQRYRITKTVETTITVDDGTGNSITKIIETQTRIDYAVINDPSEERQMVNVRVPSYNEYIKYVRNNSCDGAITANDPNVWHGMAPYETTAEGKDCWGTQYGSAQSVWHAYVEILEDNSGSDCTIYHLSDTFWWRFGLYNGGRMGSPSGTDVTAPKTVSKTTYASWTSGSYHFYSAWHAYLYHHIGFRPLFDFIDNQKSTNLFY